MKRTRYRNGDPIRLQHCGCDGCNVGTVNGKLCHETGCPEAWRDAPKKDASQRCRTPYYKEKYA